MELPSLYVYIYIFAQLYDIKYSYLIQIICTQFYVIKYSYLIQIICTQLNIMYSNLIPREFIDNYMVSINFST